VAAQTAIDSDDVSQQIRAKQKRVEQLAISSVPAFVFNHNTLVSGSHSVEYFEQILSSFSQQSA
jgi:predicted DsbA family dithiol-disulfide isomerase